MWLLSLKGGNLRGRGGGQGGSLAAAAAHRDVGGGAADHRAVVVHPGVLVGQHVIGGLGGQGSGGPSLQVSLRDRRHLGLRGCCSILALGTTGFV